MVCWCRSAPGWGAEEVTILKRVMVMLHTLYFFSQRFQGFLRGNLFCSGILRHDHFRFLSLTRSQTVGSLLSASSPTSNDTCWNLSPNRLWPCKFVCLQSKQESLKRTEDYYLPQQQYLQWANVGAEKNGFSTRSISSWFFAGFFFFFFSFFSLPLWGGSSSVMLRTSDE